MTPPSFRPEASHVRLASSALAAAFAAGATYFFSIGMILPVLPLFVAQEHGGNAISIALVVGAPAITGLVTRPIAGRLLARSGSRSLMVTGALVAGTSIMLYPIPASLAGLLSVRLLTGVGEGLFFTATTTLVADVAPYARRGAAFSLLSVMVFLGTGLGPLVAVPLADAAGIPAVMFAAGGIAATAAVVAMSTGPAGARRRLLRGSEVVMRARLLDRRAFGPGAVMALCDMGAVGFFAFVPLYALHLDAPIQVVLAAYAAVILIVRLLGSSVPDRVGAFRCGVAAAALDAVGLTIVALVNTKVGLVTGTVVFAFGVSLLYPALLTLTVGRGGPQDRPLLVGTFTMSFDVGQILGAVILGLVTQAVGLRAGFAVSACFAALGLIVLATLRGVRLRSR